MGVDPQATAARISAEIDALPTRSTEPVRAVRTAWTRALAAQTGPAVLAVARALHPSHRWPAEELIRHHRGAFARFADDLAVEFAEGLDSWWTVDAYGTTLAGPAWAAAQIPDARIWAWARSPDRWLRRLSLVCTIGLNRKAADPRTLELCAHHAEDRDDMVVKAVSWALRFMSQRDPEPVRGFLASDGERLAPRVRREVGHKLETGLKAPRRR